MKKAVTYIHIVFLSLLVSTVVLINACNDFSQFDCFEQEDGCNSNSSGGALAFQPMAGTAMAGTAMAGTAMAGTAIAGTAIAGTMLGGEEVEGTEMAGTLVAGIEMVAIEMAGIEMAGIEMAGTLMSGTEVAGSEMGGGIPLTECDPNTFDVRCQECTDNGMIEELENDESCDEVECLPEYHEIRRGQAPLCVGFSTELAQSCTHDAQRSFCATHLDCRLGFDLGNIDVDNISQESIVDYYGTSDNICYQLTDCTGDEDTDITWGCQVNGSFNPGICNQNDGCEPNVNLCVSYALGPALNEGYHLRVCSGDTLTGMNVNNCHFILENNVNDYTCDAICEQQEGWHCLGRKNRCNSNTLDENKCDDRIRNKVCVCGQNNDGTDNDK